MGTDITNPICFFKFYKPYKNPIPNNAYTVYTEGTLACYYAIFIHDYFHICIRSMECEINEMNATSSNCVQSNETSTNFFILHNTLSNMDHWPH